MSSRRRASGRDDRRHRDDVSPDAALRPPPGRRRVVLHCDADAFFCQVERSRDPSLARVPALAVFQHGDVISVDAGARAAGVTRDDAPSAAREKIRAVGGVLAHVHVVEGHRVSYRPYLAASAALMRLLASEDVARAVARATRDATYGVDAEVTGSNPARVAIDDDRDPSGRRFKVPALVVEKASIDEAYVQLPAGASLSRDARLAADAIRTLVKSRLGLVVSVGAASNKFLAKRASATCKPDGVAIVASDEDVAAVLAKTPARKVPGCGGVGVAARMRTALGAKTASDVAKKTPAALVAALGLAPAVAERAVLAARGVCDAPVVSRGAANGTVGVHTSLTAAPRRMPTRPGFEPVTSASGGRAGTFEPVRVLGTRSRRRVGGRHGARFSGEGVRRRRGGEEMAEDAHRVRRDENRARRRDDDEIEIASVSSENAERSRMVGARRRERVRGGVSRARSSDDRGRRRGDVGDESVAHRHRVQTRTERRRHP